MERNIKLLEESEALYGGLHQVSLDRSTPVMKPDTLSWDAYSKFCHTAKQNKISTQLRCSLLDDEFIRWEGSVKSVEILQVVNYKRDLLRYIKPKLLRNLMTCLLGDRNLVDCSGAGDQNCDGPAQEYAEGRWRCNVNQWNVYTYLIRTKIRSSPVLLTAGHDFGNFTRHLHANDRIWFEGQLRSKIMQRDVDFSDAEEPIIEVHNVGCVSCHNSDLKFEKPAQGPNTITTVLATVHTSFKYLLNALFNPVLIFK